METAKKFEVDFQDLSNEPSISDVPVAGEADKSSSNPFLDPAVADHYRKLYEDAEYECRHVFDPTAEWTPEEEKKIVRKLDWHVAAFACLMFFALNVDRKNINQAVSGTLLTDLNLSTNDYNYGK